MAGQQKEPKLSKRMKVVRGKVDRSKAYPVDDALKLIKDRKSTRLNSSH